MTLSGIYDIDVVPQDLMTEARKCPFLDALATISLELALLSRGDASERESLVQANPNPSTCSGS